MGKYQSAKVYVLDFHFNADNKQAISKKKKELDEFFDGLRKKLEKRHGNICEVFLRKH